MESRKKMSLKNFIWIRDGREKVQNKEEMKTEEHYPTPNDGGKESQEEYPMSCMSSFSAIAPKQGSLLKCFHPFFLSLQFSGPSLLDWSFPQTFAL